MNRKTILIALLALAVGAAGAFASGNKEQKEYGPGFYGPGPGGCPGYGYGPGGGMMGRGWHRGGPRMGPWGDADDYGLKFSEDKTTVSGPVYFHNRVRPEMTADGKDYELMVPRFYLYDLQLKESQQVTVEGYAAQREDENFLWVTKAVIDGKEYNLERAGRGPGPGYGMMGPRW